MAVRSAPYCGNRFCRVRTVRVSPGVAVAAAVVATSFSAILTRLSNAPSLVIAFYRMAMVTLMTAPLLFVGRLRGPVEVNNTARDQRTRGDGGPLDRRSLFLCVLSGLFLAAHFGTWISSLAYTSVAASTVLVTTHPVLVAVSSALILKEHIRRRSFFFMVGAVAAAFALAISGGSVEGSVLGNGLALAGSASFAGYVIIGRYVRRKLAAVTYTFAVYLVAAVSLAVVVGIAGLSFGPYPAREFLLFAALAFVCTLLGHSIFSWALRHVKAGIVSTSILGEPVIATVLALIVFDEVPSLVTVVAGAVILTCIYAFVRTESRTGA